MDIINYDNFTNICRTCLLNCDLKFAQNNIIIEVLNNLGVRFEINDELPQQICLKCVETINEINEFTLRCKQTYSSLVNCLNNIKNFNQKEEIMEETIESVKMEELIIQEPEIEFYENDESNLSNEDVNNELDVTPDIIEETINELDEDFVSETTEFISLNNEEPDFQVENTSNKDQKFECDTCSKTFSHLRSLLRHKRVHSDERSYKCDVCAKAFNESNQLKYHKRIHSGERPYICEICNKAFTQSGSLKVHKRSHTGERPYKCDQCAMSFNRTNHLKRHLLLHTGERPFKCDVCPSAFYDSSKLKVHLFKHSGERPFKCNICGSAFNDPSILYKHKVTHSSERPYECDICGNRFKMCSDLLKHKRTHSADRPHKCDVCSKSFVDSYKLKKHKTIHDRNVIFE